MDCIEINCTRLKSPATGRRPAGSDRPAEDKVLKSRIVLAIVALLVVACECSAQEDADPCGALNDAVNKATDLRGHARYEEAEALYDQTLETAITQDCRFQVARIVFGRGVLAKAEGRLTESLRLLDEARKALSELSPSSDDRTRRSPGKAASRRGRSGRGLEAQELENDDPLRPLHGAGAAGPRRRPLQRGAERPCGGPWPSRPARAPSRARSGRRRRRNRSTPRRSLSSSPPASSSSTSSRSIASAACKCSPAARGRPPLCAWPSSSSSTPSVRRLTGPHSSSSATGDTLHRPQPSPRHRVQ